MLPYIVILLHRACGGIGIRAAFRTLFPYGIGGSNPLVPTRQARGKPPNEKRLSEIKYRGSQKDAGQNRGYKQNAFAKSRGPFYRLHPRRCWTSSRHSSRQAIRL